ADAADVGLVGQRDCGSDEGVGGLVLMLINDDLERGGAPVVVPGRVDEAGPRPGAGRQQANQRRSEKKCRQAFHVRGSFPLHSSDHGLVERIPYSVHTEGRERGGGGRSREMIVLLSAPGTPPAGVAVPPVLRNGGPS